MSTVPNAILVHMNTCTHEVSSKLIKNATDLSLEESPWLSIKCWPAKWPNGGFGGVGGFFFPKTLYKNMIQTTINFHPQT
jgi:hypothetical protein